MNGKGVGNDTIRLIAYELRFAFHCNYGHVLYRFHKGKYFQDGGCQPCCIYLGVMADHPRSAFRGLNSNFKSLVRRINSSGDIVM